MAADEGETCFSVNSVPVVFDEAGNIDGLEAVLLSSFYLDGEYQADAFSVYRNRLSVAFRGFTFHRIIDWRAANGCRNTFPEFRIGGLPPRTNVCSPHLCPGQQETHSYPQISLLLHNDLYFTHNHTQYDPASVYDLSSLSPNLDTHQPDDNVEPVGTNYCCRHLIYKPLFIPLYRGDSTCLLIKTSLGITQLSIPLQESHHDPGASLKSTMLAIGTHPRRIAVGFTKFMVVHDNYVERSTVDHIFPHPKFMQLNNAHYVSFRFADCTSLWTYSLPYYHLTNRLMRVYTDRDVRIIDLVF